MHPCPHCGKPTISSIRRMNLGPAFPTRCSECGHAVGVPYWSVALVAPAAVTPAVACWLTDNPAVAACIGMFGAALTMLLWAGLVPLVKR
jgi:hypothetical protein